LPIGKKSLSYLLNFLNPQQFKKNKMINKILISLTFLFIVGVSTVEAQKQNNKWLENFAKQKKAEHIKNKKEVAEYAKKHGIAIRHTLPNGGVMEIQKIKDGKPQYYSTSNAGASQTSRANTLYSGGGLGLNITGNGYSKVGEWDGGQVLTTHQEFGGRATVGDGGGTHSDHATHVAGTIIAAGVDANAKGMAYQAELKTHDWNSDEIEMATAAAAGMELSNHSYGYVRGWYIDGGGTWQWNGNAGISNAEDYLFGFYDSHSQDWDNIAYNAPNYLIIKSAGNDRGDWDGASVLNPQDGGATGYDCIGTGGVAKNIMTVAAVGEVQSYGSASDVVMSSFSGWGPADDGRIKPDISAKGVSVYSSGFDGDEMNIDNTYYNTKNGTSMASPSVTGTLVLLRQHYQNTHGASIMKAATLKSLVLNTADEAGPDMGPDYMFGWGLINAERAAELISQDASGINTIDEQTLTNSGSYTRDITVGCKPVKVTIVWTDPAGTPVGAQLDPANSMLVNDLDLRLTGATGTHYAWKLDRNNPSNAATNSGENNIDNVETVYIADPTPGTYTITVDHDGTLASSQDFSIVIQGLDEFVAIPSACSNLLSPTDGATGLPLATSISWSEVADAISYDIYFGTDVAATNILNGVNQCGSPILKECLSSNTTYYLKIFPRNNQGARTSCSTWSFQTATVTASALFTENFDGLTEPDLPVNWIDDASNDFDWQSESGTTPSGDTGPSDDQTGGGNYIYTEASTPNNPSKTAIVYTPYINLSSYLSADLEFYYHMYGTNGNMGSLSVDIFDNGEWNNLLYKTGNQNIAVDNNWIQVTADLSQYKTCSFQQIRFMGVTDGWDSDMAVDGFALSGVLAPAGSWIGVTSIDWNTTTNWADGTIPTSTVDVTIPTGCPFYPSVDENNAVCQNLLIEDGGSLTVTTGGLLTVNGDLQNGEDVTGTFTINDGTCTITGNLYTRANSSTTISGGILNFVDWRSTLTVYAKGTIDISGGVINASKDVVYSATEVVGSMTGSFMFNCGDDFHINDNGWPVVTGGTINMTGSYDASTHFFGPTNIAYNSIAYNLIINGNSSHNFYFSRSNGNVGMKIENDLTITSGIADATNATNFIDDFDVNGDITIATNGTLVCDGTNDADIKVAGDWTNSGTFTPGTNTVTFDGTNQSIMGTTTFYNLTKSVTTARTLTFEESKTQTVTNTCTFNGTAGNILSLRSSLDGTQWKLDPSGTRTMSYLNVKDGNNLTLPIIDPANSVDNGNNIQWFTASDPPVITSVTDGDFFKDKGKQITITGTDLTGASAVSIAGIAATSIDVNTAVQIKATFPPGIYANNTLAVTTSGGSDTYTVALQTRNIIPVGGGTDFHTTIQSALDGLSAWYTTTGFNAGQLPGAKTIDVYNGTYTDIVTPNITLGTTSAEILIIQNHAGESPEINASGNANGVYIGDLDYVTFTGFKIMGATSDNIYTEGDNNIISYNEIIGSTAGSGILINNSPSTVADHNLVYNNNSFGIRLISSNNASLINNTIANNGSFARGVPLPTLYDPAEVYVESGTGVSLKNNILHSKSGGTAFTLKTETGVTVSSNYNTYYKNGNTFLTYYNGALYADLTAWSGNGAGANELESDPDFFNTGTDFHLNSTITDGTYTGGNWPPTAESGGTWAVQGTHSTAIDAGNPADAFANEPAGNGSLINQGCYGNTLQASLSSAASAIHWDGSVSTEWHVVGNWTPEQIPTLTDDAVIPNLMPRYPIIDNTPATLANCATLSIQNAASVTIAPNGELTVAGLITNAAGNAGIVIKSDATGTGSLIHNTADIDATVERYFEGASPGEWHLLSSSIIDAPRSLFTANNFYWYDESTNDYWNGASDYQGTLGWTNPTGTLVSARGYLYYQLNHTISFTGKLHYDATGYTMPASYNLHAAAQTGPGPYGAWSQYDGWNLIGNPYPSAIDWTLLVGNSGLTDLHSTVYFYDDVADNYKYFNTPPSSSPSYNNNMSVNGATKYIPAGQGFFVKTDDAVDGGSITMPLISRVHSTQNFWRNEGDNMIQEGYIRLKTNVNGSEDELVIRVSSDATSEFDGTLDAYKRYSWNPEMPQIYSMNIERNTEYAINSLPEFSESISIPLGYSINAAGNYFFELNELRVEEVDVFIEDLLLGETFKIEELGRYEFSMEAGNLRNRFILHLVKRTSEVTTPTNWLNIYPNPTSGKVIISQSFSAGAKGAKITLTDMTGKVYYEANTHNAIFEFDISHLPSGTYILSSEANNTAIKQVLVKID